MELTIYDKQTQQPLLMLSEDDLGMKVTGGDPKMVQALRLDQFRNLKEAADYVNADPNGPYTAQLDGEEQAKAPGMDDQLQPALETLKELMRRVNDKHQQEKDREAAGTAEGRAQKTYGAQVLPALNDQIYVSLDGDNIGNAVARAEETDDESQLSAISSRIQSGQDVLRQWAEMQGGRVIEQGGDEGLVKVPKAALERVEELREKYAMAVGATASVGVGNKLSESTKARMLAKLKGKNRTVIYDESTPKQLEMLLDDNQDEAKKIRTSMRPTENHIGTADAQPSEQQPQDAAVAPDAQGFESAPAEQPGDQPQEPQAGNEASPRAQQAKLSPELVAEMQRQQAIPPEESYTGTAFHDSQIEKADYSDSEDPEFSKRLRYALKYGAR